MDITTRRNLFNLHCRYRAGVTYDYTAFTAGIDEGIRTKQEEINTLKAQLIAQRYALLAAQQELIDANHRHIILNKLNDGLLKTLNSVNKG